MASSLLDELPCLLDEADELSARASFYLQLLFTTPATAPAPLASSPSPEGAQSQDPYALREALAGIDVHRIARKFHKHSLTVASSSATPTLCDKLELLLPPQESAARGALQTLAAKLFHLMKRVYQWQQTTWDDTLLPFVGHETSALSFDRHRLLTSLVLHAVAKSVKLHLLWSSYANLAGVLVLHLYLDNQNSTKDKNRSLPQGEAEEAGRPQPQPVANQQRPLDFIMFLGSNPLITIQQELQLHPRADLIAKNLLELVLSCFDCYVGCHDLARIKNGGGMVMEMDPLVLQGNYACSPLFRDLQVLPQLVEWVLCVALCLPHHWKSATIQNRSWQLWDFVELIAQDRLVLVVARDLVVNIHDLLFQQLHSALSSYSYSHNNSSNTTTTPTRSTTAGSAAMSLQPIKKALARLSKRAVQCAGEKRRERRVFVLWFLRDAVKLLRHNGALAAPLLPRLLAVLALARDELEWILAHGSNSHCNPSSKLLPNSVKPKHLDRAAKSYSIDAGALTELVALYYELRGSVERGKDCICRYYLQFIARGDADAIASEIETLIRQPKAVDSYEPVVALLGNLADKKRFQLTPTEVGFASWRREWHQLSIYLLMLRGEGANKVAVPVTLSRALDRACRHANYVQAFDQILARTGSLSKCFWFSDVLDRAMQELLLLPPSADNGDPVVVAVVLHDLAVGRVEIEELLESSEADRKAMELTHMVEIQKRSIGECLERAIDELLREEEKLHAKLSPHQVIERTMGSETKRGLHLQQLHRGTSSTTLMLLLLTPGTESRLVSTPDDAAVETAKPLANARARLRGIVALLKKYATSKLALGGMVESHLKSCLARFLSGFVQATSADRPRTLRVPWGDASRQWRALVRCLQHQFSSTQWININQLIRSVLADQCQTDSTTCAGSSINTTAGINTTTSSSSMRLLDGVLHFYDDMLQFKCVAQVHKNDNEKVALLVSLTSKSYISNTQYSSSPCPEMDPAGFASPSALQQLQGIIGRSAMQKLRARTVAYLRTHTKALYERIEKDKIALIRLKLAFPEDQSEIRMAVKIMEALDTGIIHEFICVGNGIFLLEMMDQSDRNCDHGASERELRHQLRTLWGPNGHKNDAPSPHVQAIWNLLPWAFIAAFYGSIWGRTKYLPAHEATTTNVHLVALAMRLLVDVFEPSGPNVGEPKDKDDAEHLRRERMRHIAHLTSQAVVSLRRVSPNLPTAAMVATAKQLTRSLARCDKSTTAEGEVDGWLPDFVQEMIALAA